ncbi:MAG: A/G-specific adenine glycosylase [Chlamydia sp.]
MNLIPRDDACSYVDIAKTLVSWFEKSHRPFPWRIDRTPYRVMVSEIMLQQTQASRVIAYFNRWMELFPSIEILANAPIEEVIKVWEGLGYYSRARSLKKAAAYIVFELQGIFPDSYEELEKVPGIGPYTAGAILSFAFQKPTPAIDANVARVLSRLFEIQEPMTTQKAKNILKSHALSLIKAHSSSSLIEGCIEFGATVCTPFSPKCREICPLDHVCKAFHQGLEKQLPIQIKRPSRIRLERSVFILRSKEDSSFLVVERMGKKVMSGLHEFPYFEHGELNRACSVQEAFSSLFVDQPYLEDAGVALPPFSHSFTRFQVVLKPILIEIPSSFRFDAGSDRPIWVKCKELSRLPFSSGHKRVRDHLKEVY